MDTSSPLDPEIAYRADIDPEFTRQIGTHLFGLLNRTYFRPVFVGFEDLPDRNNAESPLIYIGNHSGMSFPWDAMVFGSGFFARSGNSHTGKGVRPLVAPMLTASHLMNPFMIEKFWQRVGGLDATYANFELMMQMKESNVLIYPEGLDGIGKGFDKKYELQRFATSFVRMALKYQTDVIPIITINGEYVNPYMYAFEWIKRISRRVGIPFLPMGPIIPLLVILPWMFYYSMPAKLTFIRGKRIRWQELSEKPYDELTYEEIEDISQRVRVLMQAELDAALPEYGTKPYDWGEFFRKAFQNLREFPFYLPFGWVLLFPEFERRWKKRKPNEDIQLYTGWGASLLMLLRNPFSIFYFIPVIGLVAMMIRGMRIYRGKR